ncbi:MAG TPA: hypothetical protein DDY13_04245 [Cytophagales bacterium]|jgi:hypothetical protein|nr:hypothetical protein [Cytophagales bacterium]
MQQKKYSVEQRQFWFSWASKLLFTLISVKFWGLVASVSVSTYLIVNNSIGAGEWVTFNTTIWGLIFGMKEIFRVMEQKDMNETELADKKAEAREKIARIEASAITSSQSERSQYTPEGKEIVGNEPS